MTPSSSEPKRKSAPRTGKAAPVATGAAATARSPRARKAAPAPALEPAHRHPTLGRPPLDMTAGFPAAADTLRRDRAAISEAALSAVQARDPEFAARIGEAGLRELLTDGEVLVARLADSVASDVPGLMAEYAEWIDPIFRRRRVSLWDLAAFCAGIRDVASSRVEPDAAASVARAVGAAVEVLRKNGRLGGDGHKRDALLQWLYRGV